MSRKGKITALIIIVLIIAVAVWYFAFRSKKEVETPAGISQEITPPAATGNIDDAAEALEAELIDTKNALSGTETDLNLITDDNQVIGDFGQIYDETEF